MYPKNFQVHSNFQDDHHLNIKAFSLQIQDLFVSVLFCSISDCRSVQKVFLQHGQVIVQDAFPQSYIHTEELLYTHSIHMWMYKWCLEMAAFEIPELSLELTRSQKTMGMLCVEICCNFTEVIDTEAKVIEEGDQVLPWAKEQCCVALKLCITAKAGSNLSTETRHSLKTLKVSLKNVSNPRRPY